MKIDKDKLLKAVIVVDYFVNATDGGDSWWRDLEGNDHSADMASVCDFLRDLKKYLSEN